MISKYPKRIFCIFLISLFIVFNFYALNLGFRTIGVYDSNNPFFYPILKSLNTTTYMISADSTVSFDLSSAPVKISLHHQSEVFDLLATIEQIDSSQYTIEVFTEEETYFKGTYDVKQHRQITSMPNTNSILSSSGKSLKLIMDKDGFMINTSFLPFSAFSSMILNQTTTKISHLWNSVVLGIFIQLLGLCIIIFNHALTQLELWIGQFFYENTEFLKPTDFHIFVLHLLGMGIFIIGLILVGTLLF